MHWSKQLLGIRAAHITRPAPLIDKLTHTDELSHVLGPKKPKQSYLWCSLLNALANADARAASSSLTLFALRPALFSQCRHVHLSECMATWVGKEVMLGKSPGKVIKLLRL